MFLKYLLVVCFLTLGSACTQSKYNQVKGVVPKGCSTLMTEHDQSLISTVKSTFSVEEIDFSSSVFRGQKMELWTLKSRDVDEENLNVVMNTIQSKCDPWISLEFGIVKDELARPLENRQFSDFYMFDFLPNPNVSRIDISIDKEKDLISIHVK